MVVINRGDYWQIAYAIEEGSTRACVKPVSQRSGGPSARRSPSFADRTGELRGWDAVKLLSVQADRLQRWHRPGLLCIGDAAHAMSPVGGIGINLAIADAVAAANILADR